MALISLDKVNKVYPRATRRALDSIDLHIDRGDFVFLVGASGSGKTTLLRLMLREEEATDGEIRIGGYDLRRLPNKQVPQYRRSVGTVFQDYKLLSNKTVWENVAFTLEVIGTPRSAIRSLVPRVLQTVGLTGKEKSMPQELSGGEQQRVAIARAYVNHPQILLADEPTGNLDPTTSLGIMEVLEAINRTGTTIVMATHNEEIVNSMRKRVVELHNGKIVRDEQHGSYDSTLFFPDAQVQARSHEAITNPYDGDATDVVRGVTQPIAMPQQGLQVASLGERNAAVMVQAVSEALTSGHTDEGIARLARSVHAGNTGRYGEAFAPVEQTFTWGKGLDLDSINKKDHADSSPSDASDTEPQADASLPEHNDGQTDRTSETAQVTEPDAVSEQATEQTQAQGGTEQAEDPQSRPAPPAPPTPPAPPAARGRHRARRKKTATDNPTSATDTTPHEDAGQTTGQEDAR
ncbi:cell division ATP-binding protein FtsE [Bifidobacterium gallicum]|uniref:Cell division ATP-binding protein FtsE n=1 Tax=Bifidobacterium gallicum DSM 20093 = LMG 11596 TaxID=561180 RepID=D1NUU0_9BIFI|nr:cell division ATP-binding protein FtsE [Bifidobacterium gallicum]EFA22591.1 cell division ATP-binding protein FtsE [Bifidobacterium gallicum DSM 20093 = LMG 11596]KFI59575.1 cell division protein FtsE [Bifidobacterium gallicum DSM 20093 = LMG 11596]